VRRAVAHRVTVRREFLRIQVAMCINP
jgi:hypothetical protein